MRWEGRATVFTCANQGGWEQGRREERGKKTRGDIGVGRRGHGDNLIQLERRWPGRRGPTLASGSSVQCGGAGLVAVAVVVMVRHWHFQGGGPKGGAQSEWLPSPQHGGPAGSATRVCGGVLAGRVGWLAPEVAGGRRAVGRLLPAGSAGHGTGQHAGQDRSELEREREKTLRQH